MHSGEGAPGVGQVWLARLGPYLYVAACVLAVVFEPTSFLVVWVTLAVLYHGVLCQAAFLEVIPSAGRPGVGDGHAVLTVYRRIAPLLVGAGLVLQLFDLDAFARMVPGFLIATGAALILAVKTITFAGTDGA